MEQIGSQVGDVSTSMQEVSQIIQQQTVATQEISQSVSGVADLNSENEKMLMAMSKTLQDSNDHFTQNASGMFQDGSALSLCEMAKIDHVLFIKEIVDTVTGRTNKKKQAIFRTIIIAASANGMTASMILPSASCQTSWLMEAPHKMVHDIAKQVLTALETSGADTAFQQLRELEKASDNVVKSIDKLIEILEKQAINGVAA